MNISKAEQYLKNQYNEEKAKLEICEDNINKLNIECKQIEHKISDMQENVDIAFEIFSPNPKRNDFARDEIQRLKKSKEELTDKLNDLYGEKSTIESQLIVFNEIFSEEENSDSKVKILQRQEDERKRIARDLHDSTVQVLTNIIHRCEICTKVMDVDSVRAKLEIEVISKTVKDCINEMRDIIYNLRPMSLDDFGLKTSIEKFISRVSTDTQAEFSVILPEEELKLDKIYEVSIFRIIQECVNNSIKHSNAKHITVQISWDSDLIRICCMDDGIGFDTANDKKGFGIDMMKERVYLLSGYIAIESGKEKGTVVNIEIPIVLEES